MYKRVMSMFHKKDSCRGVTLFRWFRWKLELWYVPADYECSEHTHKNSDGEFFVVCGKNREIYRKEMQEASHWPYNEWKEYCELQQYNISSRKFWKWLTVKANTPHGFSSGSTPMVFLCWEKYRKGVKVTSPAIDFNLVKQS